MFIIYTLFGIITLLGIILISPIIILDLFRYKFFRILILFLILLFSFKIGDCQKHDISGVWVISDLDYYENKVEELYKNAEYQYIPHTFVSDMITHTVDVFLKRVHIIIKEDGYIIVNTPMQNYVGSSIRVSIDKHIIKVFDIIGRPLNFIIRYEKVEGEERIYVYCDDSYCEKYYDCVSDNPPYLIRLKT